MATRKLENGTIEIWDYREYRKYYSISTEYHATDDMAEVQYYTEQYIQPIAISTNIRNTGKKATWNRTYFIYENTEEFEETKWNYQGPENNTYYK